MQVTNPTAALMPDDTSDIVAMIDIARATLESDKDDLDEIDRYLDGNHMMPYMPISADLEYRTLARRAITNWMPIIVEAPLQMLYVDSFRRTKATPGEVLTPEMQHWQDSRLDNRQIPVHGEALSYGQSYVLTKRDEDKKVRSYGISARDAVALYNNPATDLDPVAFVHFVRDGRKEKDKWVPGLIEVYDETDYHLFEVAEDGTLTLTAGPTPHGAKECPGTRFTAKIDLKGRVSGLVKSAIPIQDRINQTIFDLLVAQTYTSFEVRTATGMAPPIQMRKDEATGFSGVPSTR